MSKDEPINTTLPHYREPDISVSELVAAIQQTAESQARLFDAFESLEKTVLEVRAERDAMLELVTELAEKLPQGCNCDVGRVCLPHRAERILEGMRG
jgi:hypothetical protein